MTMTIAVLSLLVLVAVSILKPEPIASELTCQVHDLKALVVNIRKLRTEFQDFKDETQAMFDAKQRELDAKQMEIDALRTDFGVMKTKFSSSVAFVARNPPTSLPRDVPIIFATTVLNSGDAYDNSTGRFTAPVSGTYMFSVQFCTVNVVYCQLVVNNNAIGVSTQYDADTLGICSSMSTVAVMQSGQEAWVTDVGVNGGQVAADKTSARWNMFTGALVVPT